MLFSLLFVLYTLQKHVNLSPVYCARVLPSNYFLRQGTPIRSRSRAKSGAKSRETDRAIWEQNGGGGGDGGAS